jgi:thymidylate synthase
VRVYNNFKEALSEIKRDVAEMGVKVITQTMQDKKGEFETLEVQNYIYTVVDTNTSMLNPTQPWADAEFEERISERLINPGEAYKLRPEVWEQFLENNHGEFKHFSYTYPYRIGFQIGAVIDELRLHPDSRQLFITIWDIDVDHSRFGRRRVPCSLGYFFQYREGKLHVTYLQRSADFVTHFQNDLYLAVKLRDYIADKVGMVPGRFTHWIGSLHVYKEDVKDVF